MLNSIFEVMAWLVSLLVSRPFLHFRFEATWEKTRACVATLLWSRSWCYCSSLLGFGWARSASLTGSWSWLSCGDFQRTCTEGWQTTASCSFAWWAVVRGSLRRRSIYYTCDSVLEQWEKGEKQVNTYININWSILMGILLVGIDHYSIVGHDHSRSSCGSIGRGLRGHPRLHFHIFVDTIGCSDTGSAPVADVWIKLNHWPTGAQ